MKTTRFFSALLLSVLVAGAARSAELTVHAAASLSDVMKEIATLYAQASTDTLQFNFGASGALARQVKEGAPGDVFISADELRVDQLEKAGLLLDGTRRTIVANALVVIVAAEGGPAVPDLTALSSPAVRRIAIGEPATVPVGTYTKEHLQKLGLWKGVIDKLVPVDNVRAVLASVESGNAEAGFVYKTDALISRKVKIAVEVPVAEGPRITYPVAVLQESKHPDNAKAFVVFLASPAAQAVFAKFGFLPPN